MSAAPFPFTDFPHEPLPEAWRDRDLLVTLRHARVADRCLRCGDPARHVRGVKLRWHAPVWYALLALSPLIYCVAALAVSQRAWLELGLCDAHARRRRRATAVGWAAVLAGLGAILQCTLAPASLLAAVAPLGHVAVGGLVALLVGLVVLAARHEVRVVRMDEQRVWLKGASPGLLETLGPAFGARSPACLPRALVSRLRKPTSPPRRGR